MPYYVNAGKKFKLPPLNAGPRHGGQFLRLAIDGLQFASPLKHYYARRTVINNMQGNSSALYRKKDNDRAGKCRD